MNEDQAKEQEQALIETVDSQLSCSHTKTQVISTDAGYMIACVACPFQETESEYTERRERGLSKISD